jgi:hypothetical protein
VVQTKPTPNESFELLMSKLMGFAQVLTIIVALFSKVLRHYPNGIIRGNMVEKYSKYFNSCVPPICS